jgi:hypothetical protein
LTALLLLTAVAVGLLVFVTQRPGVEVAEGFAAERVRGCVDGGHRVDVSRCLRDGLLLADELGRLREGVDELSRLVTADPGLHDACHFAAHQAGRQVALRRGDVPSLLAEYPDMLCSWGFGHGLLEGFAKAERSGSEWQEAAAACDRFTGLPGELSAPWALCADGFGHAVWDASREFGAAIAGCGLLGSPGGLEACVGGVLMQRFRPADRDKGTPAASGLAPEQVVAVCGPELDAALASAGLLDRAGAVRAGCAAGVGYVLAMDVLADRLAELGRSTDAAGGGVRDVVAGAVAVAVSACERLGPGSSPDERRLLASACLGVVVPYLPRAELAVDGEDPCAVLPDRWRPLCVAPSG